MDKIAIITDIHGCLISLETVLADIEKQGIKHIYCLGDLVAKGSQPKEVLELVREKCEVVLKGNCDDIVGEKGTTDEHFWNKEKIGKENMEYLKNLPLKHEFYMSGQKVLLLHASPKSIYETINLYNIDSSITMKMEEMHEETDADIIIFGHTHSPFFYRVGESSIISVGSVSNGCDIMKKEANEAQYTSYLIIEGEYGKKDKITSISFEYVKIPYDYESEIKKLEESDMPNRDMAIEELKTGKYVAR